MAVQPQWEPYKPPILQHVAMHDCEPYQGEMVPVVVQIPPPLRPKKPNAKGRNEAGFAYIYQKNSTKNRYMYNNYILP